MFWGFAVWADRFWATDFWEGELESSPVGGYPYPTDREINERRKRRVFKKRNAVLVAVGLV